MSYSFIRTLIIDDEEHIRDLLRFYLLNRPDVVLLGECSNVEDAKVMIKNSKPDLLLLDINMGNESGFELVKQFPSPNFKVIFVTAYEQYALHALKAGAIDYILKPVDEDELNLAIDKINKEPIKALDLYRGMTEKLFATQRKISVNTREGVYVYYYEDILYCEASGGYTIFYLSDNTKTTVAKPLKDYEELLPGGIFLRVHQSFIINQNHIAILKKDQNVLTLRNPVSGNLLDVPVSARKREEVFNSLIDINKNVKNR